MSGFSQLWQRVSQGETCIIIGCVVSYRQLAAAGVEVLTTDKLATNTSPAAVQINFNIVIPSLLGRAHH